MLSLKNFLKALDVWSVFPRGDLHGPKLMFQTNFASLNNDMGI